MTFTVTLSDRFFIQENGVFDYSNPNQPEKQIMFKRQDEAFDFVKILKSMIKLDIKHNLGLLCNPNAKSKVCSVELLSEAETIEFLPVFKKQNNKFVLHDYYDDDKDYDYVEKYL